ncbi:MAG: hypothetical protein N2Z69_00135, partial [Methylophilaceae bacterium]|nr:hypothetical protein [Methylophilaceae bacterium]
NDSKQAVDRMITNFPTAPLAPGHTGAGGGTVEKSPSASHTEILTLPGSNITRTVNHISNIALRGVKAIRL